MTLRECLTAWEARDLEEWRVHPEWYCHLARRFLRLDDPLIAAEVAREGHAIHAADIDMRYLDAFALARAGASMQAQRLAADLCAEIATDHPLFEDAWGLLGRTRKDMAEEAVDAVTRRQHLVGAMEAYRHAYEVGRGPYAGINAATLALLTGDEAYASAVAAEVSDLAAEALRGCGTGSVAAFWHLATIAEASLLRGAHAEACERYAEAVASPAADVPAVASVRRQARRIVAARCEDDAWIDRIMPIPTVIVFTGDVVATSDQAATHDARGETDAVTAALRSRLDSIGTAIGYASAAAGPEIVFHEQVRARGGRSYVVLPYGVDDFRAAHVTTNGAGWGARFDVVIAEAEEVIVAAERRSVGRSVLFEYAALLVAGRGVLHARALDTRLGFLALRAGTASSNATNAVDTWRDAGHEVEVLWPMDGAAGGVR